MGEHRSYVTAFPADMLQRVLFKRSTLLNSDLQGRDSIAFTVGSPPYNWISQHPAESLRQNFPESYQIVLTKYSTAELQG